MFFNTPLSNGEMCYIVKDSTIDYVIDYDNVISSIVIACVSEICMENFRQTIFENFNSYYNNKEIKYIHSFGTNKLYRHKGYGRKLLQYVKEKYKGYILILDVGSLGPMTQEQLIDFYKSEGFKQLANKPYYRMIIVL